MTTESGSGSGLGRNTLSWDTYLRLVHWLDPETTMKAALLPDGTSLPNLRQLILALDGKWHAGWVTGATYP